MRVVLQVDQAIQAADCLPTSLTNLEQKWSDERTTVDANLARVICTTNAACSPTLIKLDQEHIHTKVFTFE